MKPKEIILFALLMLLGGILQYLLHLWLTFETYKI